MLLAIRYPEAVDAAGFRRLLEAGGVRAWIGDLDGAAVGFAAVRLVELAERHLARRDRRALRPPRGPGGRSG